MLWRLETQRLPTQNRKLTINNIFLQYAFIISILLIIEVICGIFVLVYHDKVRF